MRIKRLLIFLKKVKKGGAKIIIFTFLLFIPINFTLAAPWDPVVKGLLLELIAMVLGIVALIGFILGTLSKIFLSMLTEMVRWAAIAKIGGLSFTKRDNPFIDAGLKVTLPLANMAFILIFVVIAIATILGTESYSVRKSLPVLIIMALLVNFAPVLVGLMVDAGNIITYHFVKGLDFTKFVEVDQNKIGEFIKNTAISFARAFKAAGYVHYIQWALTGNCSEEGEGRCDELAGNNEIPGGIMLPTLYLAGSAASMTIAIITLVMAIAMFLVRNLAMWLLTILAPLAFAAYVLPPTRKAFHAWWRQLLQWAFVGVSLSFFLYLATVMCYVADKIEISTPTQAGTAAQMINDISLMIVKTMFPAIVMVIGLFLSAQGGNKFAGITLTQSKKIGNWAKGLGAGMGMAAAGYVGAKTIGGAKGFFGKEGTRRYELARKLEQSRFVPIKPGALTGYRREEVDEKTEELKKGFKIASTNELQDRATLLSNKRIFGKERIAEARALITELTERDALKDDYFSLVKALEQQGFQKEAKIAKKKLPSLAIKDITNPTPKDEETLKELYRGMTAEEKRKIQPEAYDQPLVTKATLSMITDKGDFGTIISNYKSAQKIGEYIANLGNKTKLATEIGDHAAKLVEQQLQKPSVQRRTGVTMEPTGDIKRI